MIRLTFAERRKVQTEFAENPSLDVQVIMRDGKVVATITRTNQLSEFR